MPVKEFDAFAEVVDTRENNALTVFELASVVVDVDNRELLTKLAVKICEYCVPGIELFTSRISQYCPDSFHLIAEFDDDCGLYTPKEPVMLVPELEFNKKLFD